MSIEKIQIVDLIEVVENGCVQVRTKIAITENGTQIGESFNRHIIAPGGAYDTEAARVKSICMAVHTDAVIAAYAAQGE